MNYPKYQKYKNSGIAWLGEIPEHWQEMRGKDIGKFDGSTVDKKIKEGEDLVRIVNFTDIFNNQSLEIHKISFMKVSAKPNQISSFNLKIGDVLFTPSSEDRFDIGRSNVVKYTDESLLYSYHLIRLRFKIDIDVNFKKYLFNNKYVFGYFSSVCTGTTRQILVRDKFKNIPIILPPKQEQTTIANFLDYKTEKINRFITKKKRLIELLKEQKTAIINEMVTGKINCLNHDTKDSYDCPDLKKSSHQENQKNQDSRKMKDSGIEWLGEIPEHWEVRKLKYVGKCQNGISAGAEYFGSGYPFMTYGDIYNNFSIPKIASGLANSSENDRINYSVIKGDVFFTRTSETIEEIGLTSTCVESVKNATFSGFIIRMRPFKNLLNELYSKYYFRSSLHRRFFVKEMNLVTRASLSQDLLKKMPILLPPMEEQKIIANYIEAETEKINKTIATIEKEITLVEEYKTALIAEAVTGKIDVRKWSKP